MVAGDVRDLRFDKLSLALVGEAKSKSFGVAFRGVASPKVAMTGSEKPVVRLYAGCASGKDVGPNATNVATVELGSLPAGKEPTKLTMTKDTTAFLPMQEINCAVIDLQ